MVLGKKSFLVTIQVWRLNLCIVYRLMIQVFDKVS